MQRTQADVPGAVAVAAAACIAPLAGAPVLITAVTGTALLAAPGYLLAELLLGPSTSRLERVLAGAGLALCAPVLGGLALYVARVPLHRPAWLALLTGLTLAAGAALVLRRRSGAPAPDPESGPEPGPGPVADTGPGRPARAPGPIGATRLAAGLAVTAMLLASGAVVLARTGASRQHYPGFTQLWLVHRDPQAATASLGISNHEGAAVRYQVVLVRGHRPVTRWTISLADGQSWHRAPAVPARAALSVRLFRLPDTAVPYRSVTLAGHSAAAAP